MIAVMVIAIPVLGHLITVSVHIYTVAVVVTGMVLVE